MWIHKYQGIRSEATFTTIRLQLQARPVRRLRPPAEIRATGAGQAENEIAKKIRYRAQDFLGELVARRQSLAIEAVSRRRGGKGHFTANFCGCARAYYGIRRAYTGMAGHDAFKGRIVHRSAGLTISTHR